MFNFCYRYFRIIFYGWIVNLFYMFHLAMAIFVIHQPLHVHHICKRLCAFLPTHTRKTLLYIWLKYFIILLPNEQRLWKVEYWALSVVLLCKHDWNASVHFSVSSMCGCFLIHYKQRWNCVGVQGFQQDNPPYLCLWVVEWCVCPRATVGIFP